MLASGLFAQPQTADSKSQISASRKNVLRSASVEYLVEFLNRIEVLEFDGCHQICRVYRGRLVL